MAVRIRDQSDTPLPPGRQMFDPVLFIGDDLFPFGVLPPDGGGEFMQGSPQRLPGFHLIRMRDGRNKEVDYVCNTWKNIM